MTREEIKNTPELVDFMLDKCVLADSRAKVHTRLKEVCDLATKALKQEPCDDAISRQTISDYVESHIQEINTGYGDLNKHTNEILRMIVDYIEKMEPVTPQLKWISISERLPEVDEDGDSDYIFISLENYSLPVIGRYAIDQDGDGSFYEGDEERTLLSYGLFVNAWMPLPKPYRESE